MKVPALTDFEAITLKNLTFKARLQNAKTASRSCKKFTIGNNL